MVRVFYLARMNRRTWVRAHVITLFTHIVELNIFLLFCFAVASGGRITLAGEWSRAAFMGAQFGSSEVIGLRGIFLIFYGLLSFNPNVVGALSLLLAVLLGMTMGLVMMIFALWHKTAFGGMVLFLLWFLDVLAVSVPIFKVFQYILPFGLARLSYTTWNYGAVAPDYCILFLLIFTLLLIWISDFVCDQVDFVKIG